MNRSVAWIAASAVALACGAAAVRAAAVRVPETGLAGALGIDGADARMALAIDQLLENRGRIDPEVARAAIDAARARPLDDRPYLVAAIGALTAEREDDGIALLERARRLNPRQRPVRLLLMDRYLRAGRIDAATAEIATVARLLPETQEALVTELSRLLLEPGTGPTIRAILTDRPLLLDASLATLARQGTATADVLRIAGTSAPAGTDPGGWRAVLIEAAMARGEYRRARDIWRNAYRVPETTLASIPFDPDFTGSAPPPFGWNLTASELGSAEREGSALNVQYFGRASGVLARQLVLMPPGRHRLSYQIEGSDGDEPGAIALTVTCARAGGATLASVPAPRLGTRVQRVEAAFAVPADCPAQWLQITGTARQFAAQSNVTVRAPSITAVR